MTDEFYIKRCLQIAAKGMSTVAPNPMVGAVLVHQDRIIGEGFHEQYGEAHAEVNCFESVAAVDKNLIPESTLYVSLEPCAHYGKTPPCANRIVAEKVKRVVICNNDPFEKVAGKGIQLLQENGIEVSVGILEEEGLLLNRRFFTFHNSKRPYIILKWAQSADGFIAPKDGSRLQLTDELSQRVNHQWRSEEAAILVGFNTALADNPQLTNRYSKGAQPLRIALDRNLKLPLSHHLFIGEQPTWIINQVKNERKGSLQLVQLDFENNLLKNLLHQLFLAGKNSLIVEGGAQLLHSFIAENLWDEARIFDTPKKLNRGIEAPLLQKEHFISETSLAADTLKIYRHKSSSLIS